MGVLIMEEMASRDWERGGVIWKLYFPQAWKKVRDKYQQGSSSWFCCYLGTISCDKCSGATPLATLVGPCGSWNSKSQAHTLISWAFSWPIYAIFILVSQMTIGEVWRELLEAAWGRASSFWQDSAFPGLLAPWDHTKEAGRGRVESHLLDSKLLHTLQPDLPYKGSLVLRRKHLSVGLYRNVSEGIAAHNSTLAACTVELGGLWGVCGHQSSEAWKHGKDRGTVVTWERQWWHWGAKSWWLKWTCIFCWVGGLVKHWGSFLLD